MFKSSAKTSIYRNGSEKNSENNVEYNFHKNIGRVYNVQNGSEMERIITKEEFDSYLESLNLSISKEIFTKALSKLFNFSPTDELSNYSYLSHDCSLPISIGDTQSIQMAPITPLKYNAAQYVTGLNSAKTLDSISVDMDQEALSASDSDSETYSDDFSDSDDLDSATVFETPNSESSPILETGVAAISEDDEYSESDEFSTAGDSESEEFDSATVFESPPETPVTGSPISTLDGYDLVVDSDESSEESTSDSSNDSYSDEPDDTTMFEMPEESQEEPQEEPHEVTITDSDESSGESYDEDLREQGGQTPTPVENFDELITLDGSAIRTGLVSKSKNDLVYIAERLNINTDDQNKSFLVDAIQKELGA